MEQFLNSGTEIKFDGGKLTVRRLGVMDVFAFAKLLSSLDVSTFTKMSSQLNISRLQSEDEELTQEEREQAKLVEKQNAQQIGFQMFASLVDKEDELMKFLSGLTDLSVEEFKKIPPDVAIDVITAVIQGEDIKRFFAKAGALMTTNLFSK